MASIADSILTTAILVLLDKAAQTGVKSSPKQGVMQAVDRELRGPSHTQARDPFESEYACLITCPPGMGLVCIELKPGWQADADLARLCPEPTMTLGAGDLEFRYYAVNETRPNIHQAQIIKPADQNENFRHPIWDKPMLKRTHIVAQCCHETHRPAKLCAIACSR